MRNCWDWEYIRTVSCQYAFISKPNSELTLKQQRILLVSFVYEQCNFPRIPVYYI